jgi:hypothetical protein
MKVRIRAGDIECAAELNDSETARRIASALPIEGKVRRWGEEIYFEIPVDADEAEDARQDMEIGELAYWPPGNALCIFFGPTPASRGEVPRAASNVNPVGRVLDDATRFRRARSGVEISIEPAARVG